MPSSVISSFQLTEAMSGDPVQLQSLSETTLSVIQSGSLLPGDISSLSSVILQTADLVNNMTNPQTIQVRFSIK